VDASTLTPNLSREEEAKLALENTVITPLVARLLIALFLLTIFSVPALQHTIEIRRNMATRQELIAQGGEAADQTLWPQIYDVFALLPPREKLTTARTLRNVEQLLPQPAQITDYEETLEENSVVNQWILPRAQTALIGLGAGNEQAYVGHGNWLMYRPDVDYLTGLGFLEPWQLQARQRAGDASTAAAQPDPLKAIVDFKQQLARRDISLLVVMAPVKASIHPEKLSMRFGAETEPLQNNSFKRFKEELQRNGVLVVDPAPLIQSARHETQTPQYLETDTHWTPSAMERTAQAVAIYIKTHAALPPRDAENYTRRSQHISNVGDIALMLKLPEQQTRFRAQRVLIHPVQTSDGEDWYPRRNADILLLGDSFTNIYSLAGMGWGEAAGFAEQLSFALQRPLDRIAINAGGALSSRQELWKELKRGRNRLRGKRLVIYEFAARDLSIGDWKIFELPPAKQ
jgi:alginate O-acetyltransferase complex protein AlgJ